MKKRILAVILCFVCVISLFSACESDDGTINLPVAEHNPNIRNPEGKLYEFNGNLMADGGLVALGEDFLKLMIEGKEVEFALSDSAIEQINIFNKDKNNLMIKRGTMLSLTYKIENLVYVVYQVEIIDSN